MRGTGETYGQAWAEADDNVAARNGLLRSVWASVLVEPGVRGSKIANGDRFVYLD